MIKIAASSLCGKYIDDVISIAQKNEYKAIEWDLNFIPPVLSESRINYIIQTISKGEIEIRFHLPYSFIEVAHSDRIFCDYSVSTIEEYLKFIHKLGGKYAVLHVGYFEQSNINNALININKVATRAKKLGICICIENLVRGLSTHKIFWEKVLTIDNVFFCLDIGHAEYLRRHNRNDIFNLVSEFKDMIVHAHVYDYEDDHINHIPFSVDTVKKNIWLPLLLATPCFWYTMELDLACDQEMQIRLLKENVF